MSDVPHLEARRDLRAGVEAAAPVPHLYVHWPFCARKCPYCDFNSHAGKDEIRTRYAEALIAEATRWRGLVKATTVFVGGGTPTYVDAEGLEHYLGGVRDALDLTEVAEWTIEANPGSLDAAKVEALLRVGVNRVSLGVQSFDDRHLHTLGRIHDGATALRAIEVLRTSGLPRFSLDLILATPGQSLADQEADLRQAIDLAPEHLSAYVLTFEEGTAFTRMLSQGLMDPPEPERELQHLHMARDALGTAGYARYEISNYAKAGCESQHNLAYWQNADWIGIGAGAHSHVAGVRWDNVKDPAVYARRVESGDLPTASSEQVGPDMRALEMLMMGLRLTVGVDLAKVEAVTGVRIEDRHVRDIDELAALGLIALEGRQLRLVGRGFDVANAIIGRFYPA